MFAIHVNGGGTPKALAHAKKHRHNHRKNAHGESQMRCESKGQGKGDAPQSAGWAQRSQDKA
jgi:hypothetical protein